MKSYLQRLAERAEGVSLTRSLNPTPNEGLREAGSDSTVDTFGEVIHQTPTASDNLAQDQSLHNFSKQAEPRAQIAARVRDSARLGPADSPDPIETRSGPVPVAESGLDVADARVSQRLEPPREIVFPAKIRNNQRNARGKRAATGNAHSMTRKSLPRSQQPETDRQERPGLAEPEHRAEQTTRDARQELLSPVQPLDDPAPVPKETSAVANDRAVTTLEPPRAEATAQAKPMPDEPRLVIGQLRVDIVPTGPTATREVVRVVHAGANRTVRSGPVSKLRFGLGQM